jgi:hypothetical protein
MEKVMVLNPVAEFQATVRQKEQQRINIKGKIIGILNNNKPNARIFFDSIEEVLRKRLSLEPLYQVRKSVPAKGASEELLETVANNCQVAITGTGD